MMLPAATARVVLVFADREGDKARISFRIPFSLPSANAAAVRNFIIARILPLTDAVLISTQIVWDYADATPTLPASAIVLQSKVVLFYRNVTRSEAFYIPAPKALLYETTGDYAGIRVDIDNPTVLADITALSAALADTTTPEGQPFPNEYVVGGFIL